MRRYSIVLLAIALLLTLFSSTLTAQDFCREAVGSDMASIGQSCQTVDANTLCLAQGNGEFIFEGDTTEIEPGDQVANTDFESISLGTSGTGYPVAYVRKMANLPAAYTNNNIVMVATGQVAVVDTSDLNMEALTDELVAVDAEVSAATEILSFPPNFGNRRSDVVGELAANTAVQADVQTVDGDFVRIAYEYPFGPSGRRVSAWIATASLADADLVADLPTLAPGQFTPLQSFLVAPSDDCTAVPTRVLIQSPGNVSAEIQAYGVDMVINSAVVLNLIRQGNSCFILQVIPVMGTTLVVDPEDPDDVESAIQVTPTTFFEIEVCLRQNAAGRLFAEVDPQFRARFAALKAAYEAGVVSGANIITQAIINILDVFANIPGFLLPYELFPPVIISPSGVGQPVPIFETFDPPTS